MAVMQPQLAYSYRGGLGDAATSAALTPSDDTAASGTPPSLLATGLAFGLVALGGALTGYIAAGDGKGALTGAAVHTSLAGLGASITSVNRLSGGRVLLYGLISLAAGGTAGYLFLKRKHRR